MSCLRYFFNLAGVALHWTILIGAKEESRPFHNIIQDASTIHLNQRISRGGQINHRQRAGVMSKMKIIRVSEFFLRKLIGEAKILDNHRLIDPVAAVFDRKMPEYQPLRISIVLFTATLNLFDQLSLKLTP